MQSIKIDLAYRAPVRTHLRIDPRGQGNLRKSFKYPLAVPSILFLIIEYQLQIGEPEQRKRSQMGYVRDSAHLNFERNGDLLLDLFRGDPRPLRDDLDIVVCHVGIGFYGKLMK